MRKVSNFGLKKLLFAVGEPYACPIIKDTFSLGNFFIISRSQFCEFDNLIMSSLVGKYSNRFWNQGKNFTTQIMQPRKTINNDIVFFNLWGNFLEVLIIK